MKFRSVYLIIIGLILQIIFSILILSLKLSGGVFNALVQVFILSGGIMIIITAFLIGIVLAILITYKKTRKVAAILSIIFGVIFMILYFGAILGFFLAVAGIYALVSKK